ncbi:hypothetical protein N0V93_002050 [Gnomoniopsis smithogilvyi]|uniref:Carboxylic ester hydrolase n=1 Tax=Gnomoniopsis smithogilvyi TaxID=1191159 RepID=A0A9W8Z4Y2_9PEZI|nr:hypothetical protein N0V93_002050 [Gnomoniopsis smithogilvyi]
MLFTNLLLLLITSPPATFAQRLFFNYNIDSRQAHNVSSPIVDLGYAKYEGTRLKVGVDQYLGIRYAQPPVGDLRFRAPREPLPESATQDATEFGPLCIGVAQSPPVDGSLSEDCLTASVFTPSNATPNSKLPVWLFIQGGGYATLGQFFNGTEVVRASGGEMVFVNFNYRVGALGFLASETLREDGDLNAGLLDQRRMLEWVQEHIAQFGGDPAHVVIHGPSAGAGSVTHHLTAYDGEDRGLFVGAIAQSPFWPTQRNVSQSEIQFSRFVNSIGCAHARNNSSVMACLRAAPLARIQQANVDVTFEGASGAPIWYWLPVTEGPGTLVPDLLYNSLAAGKFVKVPLMVGDDNNEGTVFVTNASSANQVSTFLQNNYPQLTQAELARINEAYPRVKRPPPTRAAYFASLAGAYGEATFTCAGNRLAEAMADALGEEQVWNYRVNVLDPMNLAAGLGVPHVFENVAIFGRGNTGAYSTSWDTINAAIIPVIMNYYISFVRALDPNMYKYSPAPAWENWGGGMGRRLRLQTNLTGMEDVPGEQANRCALWRSLSHTTQQ